MTKSNENSKYNKSDETECLERDLVYLNMLNDKLIMQNSEMSSRGNYVLITSAVLTVINFCGFVKHQVQLDEKS